MRKHALMAGLAALTVASPGLGRAEDQPTLDAHLDGHVAGLDAAFARGSRHRCLVPQRGRRRLAAAGRAHRIGRSTRADLDARAVLDRERLGGSRRLGMRRRCRCPHEKGGHPLAKRTRLRSFRCELRLGSTLRLGAAEEAARGASRQCHSRKQDGGGNNPHTCSNCGRRLTAHERPTSPVDLIAGRAWRSQGGNACARGRPSGARRVDGPAKYR